MSQLTADEEAEREEHERESREAHAYVEREARAFVARMAQDVKERWGYTCGADTIFRKDDDYTPRLTEAQIALAGLHADPRSDSGFIIAVVMPRGSITLTRRTPGTPGPPVRRRSRTAR